MTDISELDQRLQTALERISAAFEGLGQAAADAALREELEAEKMAIAQMEERIRALREQNEAQLREAQSNSVEKIAALEAELAELRTEAQDVKTQNRTLRQSNQRLQASLTSLREAGTGEVEPHLLNHAMMSELEALRAARTSDRAEMEEILGALKPLLKENANA